MEMERVENEDQSSTLLAGLAVKPVWTEYPDQPSPGGVGNSPCAGDIAGASKPAVGLRWCPRQLCPCSPEGAKGHHLVLLIPLRDPMKASEG